MALPTLFETHDSREATVGSRGGGVTLRFIATGTTLETEVHVATLLVAPEFFDGFVRSEFKYSPLGGPNWHVEVTYSPTGEAGGDQPAGASDLGGEKNKKPSSPDDSTALKGGWSFDTSGETVHITQSRQTVSKSAGAPDNKKAIGLTKDRVEGVDVRTRKLEWSRTVSRDVCTMAYVKTLKSLTGTVNDAEFYTHDALTTLYLGATGNYTQSDGWSVTHKFMTGDNDTDLDIGNTLVVPFKRAWDYLWIGYEDQVVGTRVLQVPIAWYVERVYKSGDMTGLEISG